MTTIMKVRNLLVMISLNWEKRFFPLNTEIALKNLKKVYQAEISFIINWIIVKLVVKIMNILFTFGKHLEWKHKILSWYVSKFGVLSLAYVFETFPK